MDFFTKLGTTISNAGKDGLNKAKEVKDTTKLTIDIKERQTAIQKYYRELGKAYYNDHKDDTDCPYIQIDKIKDCFAKIEDLKAERESIKAAATCPGCGEPVARNASYCANCGAEIKKAEPEEEVFEEEDVEVFSGDVVDSNSEE